MQTYGTTGEGRQSRLKEHFPSFSTSKYAQAKRSHGQLPPGVQEPSYWIKDQGPVKVEAKVWLANQRTFIKWQHVSILLGTLGLGLYNAAGENNNVARTLAVVYTVVAIFTGAWGYGIYMWRVNLIQKRSGKDFDAITGPIVVCVGLIVALILNFAFKVRLDYLAIALTGRMSTDMSLPVSSRTGRAQARPPPWYIWQRECNAGNSGLPW